MNSYYPKQQSGVVLIISLIMLLLLTILGVTAMQVNGLEEKMAGNSRDQNIAFQAAESTLHQAETFILNNPTDETTYTGVNGLLNDDDTDPSNFFTLNWNANDSQEGENPNSAFELAENPRYVIKKLTTVTTLRPAGTASGTGTSAGTAPLTTIIKTYFKITARSVGRSTGTQIILQEYFVHTNEI